MNEEEQKIPTEEELTASKINNSNTVNSAATPKSRKKTILVFLLIAVIVGTMLVTLINDFSNADSMSFAQVVKTIGDNWYYLLYAATMFVLVILFRSLTMFFMIHANTGRKRLLLCIKTVILGKYYDYITPLGTGGQPFQIFYLNKKDVPEGVSISVPLSEFTIYRIIFILLSIVALVLNKINVFETSRLIGTAINIMAVVGLVVNALIPGFVILFSLSYKVCSAIIKFVVKLLTKLKLTKAPDVLYNNIMTALEKNSKSFKKMTAKRGLVLLSSVFSIIATVALCSIAFFVLKTFGYQTSDNVIYEWMQVTIIVLVLYNAITFIPTPGNSGAADISFYLLFSATLAVGTASLAMLTWRIYSYYLFILAGIILVVSNYLKNKKSIK